ncbi:hypothetical protein HWV62_15044 [Athelia sp. TMB]|nr:hypothetical protein HWV62_15044 [Athelia sp. TMB]
MASKPSTATAPAMPASFLGINHLKLPANDIIATRDFYVSHFPFTYLPQYDHFTPEHTLFAVMIMHEPTKLIVEIRHHPAQAAAQRGWDPVTWGVDTRSDLEDWARWLGARGVTHSRVFTGIKGWVLGAEDPDGKIVRIYCNEEHEWTDHPDQDAYWLGN